MIDYTVYDENTGRIIRTGYCPEDQYEIQAQGYSVALGSYTCDKYYWEGGFNEIPEKPEGEYVFNYASKQWEFDAVAADSKAKQKRDQLLAEGPDRINPMWWSSMSVVDQEAWTQYRQDLLDITSQTDYPEFIVWPIKP